MGDEDYEAERRLRWGRRGFVMLTLILVGVLIGAGAWVNGQTPAAVALQPVPAEPAPPVSALGDDAQEVTDRLSVAAGRSMESLAEELPGEVINPLESEAPTVGGAAAAGGDYSETLAELDEAEAAAAESLATTEEELARAERDRAKAAKDLASEEAAAARQIDAAIEAAILAARAQDAYTVPFGAGGAGSIPSGGAATNSAAVLKLVRQYFPASEVGNAMAVARCESGHANRVGKPNANGSRDFGVFQINDGGTLQAALRGIGVKADDISDARKKALNAKVNVQMARAIWGSRGWQPWVCASKLKIVAGLYQRTPGPMDGKYDEYGRA
ncbi:MAG: hypothetical protein OEV20_09500 [Actinomycetota bacterium]|nr:hypothetical protein [Actinomycetota bacterium]MDH4017564.1 hypothetical protein [Actinomycetota bacterium]